MLLEGQLAILERLALTEVGSLLLKGHLAVLERLVLTDVRILLYNRG